MAMFLLYKYMKTLFAISKKRSWHSIKNGENTYWYYIPQDKNEKMELNYCIKCGKAIDHNENCAQCTKCKTIN